MIEGRGFLESEASFFAEVAELNARCENHEDFYRDIASCRLVLIAQLDDALAKSLTSE